MLGAPWFRHKDITDAPDLAGEFLAHQAGFGGDGQLDAWLAGQPGGEGHQPPTSVLDLDAGEPRGGREDVVDEPEDSHDLAISRGPTEVIRGRKERPEAECNDVEMAVGENDISGCTLKSEKGDNRSAG